ncbi:protein N-lysine methyltransferase METTL21A-like [Saccoglossus kowalevskii]|uniref:Protein N-lysine methyltransferase METTL21A-like n=1 Tax=Saccoglossus kowalevskii TaxID=10224 RepID=A0ABM0MUU6_SACKO|nr:PREDICTED: protein N-lysine methyltransferase METTL21A-like [Saccoglossus kowalevskii]
MGELKTVGWVNSFDGIAVLKPNPHVGENQGRTRDCIPSNNSNHVSPQDYLNSHIEPESTSESIGDLKSASHTCRAGVDCEEDGISPMALAIVFCEYLEKSISEHALDIKDKTIIELGAGTGLVGMVTALLGGNVIITDREMALEQLQQNIDDNVMPDDITGQIKVKELCWGKHLDQFPTFDIILGADIIYIQETFPDLLKTLLHLSHCRTRILLSCKIRYKKDSNFIESLKVYFTVSEIFYDLTRDVRIYEAIKKYEHS